jgi:hypothetical protein
MRYRGLGLAIWIGLLAVANCCGQTTRTWKGPATGDWFTAANWLPNTDFPRAGDTVVVTNGSVLLSAPTESLASFSITNATMVFTNWSTSLIATNVTVLNNGILTLPAAFTNGGMTNRVHVSCSNFTLQVGGQIQADARGFADQNGPGTTSSAGTGISGAGHGGRGGVGQTLAAAGIVYGDAHAPLTPGSGAPAYGANPGHHGGGAVFIDATGTVTLNGTISANAGKVTTPSPVNFAGGGSGGSIFVRCHAFGGGTNGLLRANGGSGGTGGGAGAGGRIAVDYQMLVGTPGVRMSANRGQGAWYRFDANTVIENRAAQLGTLWFPDPGLLDAARGAWDGIGLSGFSGYVMFASTNIWTPASLHLTGSALGITNGNRWAVAGNVTLNGAELWIPAPSEFDAAGALTMTNSASLIVYSAPTNASRPVFGQRIGVTNVMTVASNCWVYPYSDGTNGGSVLFVVGALNILAGGGFNADGRGYGGTNGLRIIPGANAGAGHGGRGGHATTSAAGGPPYGSTNAPVNPGSAAGRYADSSAYLNANGGGLIRIEAAGNVNVDGTLTANGMLDSANPSNFGRGGSGGGIFILGDTFSGAGTGRIRANGGAGGTAGGGGGGGRISIGIGLSSLQRQQLLAGDAIEGLTPYYQHVPFGGQLSVTNGAGYSTNDLYRAHVGTAQFMHIVGSAQRSVVIGGVPEQYGSPAPQAYGTWTFEEGTVVTNSVVSPTGESNGVRRACAGWLLTDTGLGTTNATGDSTEAVFTVTTNLTLTWRWTNEYLLGFSASDNGSVNHAALGGWYTNATEVTGLLATPASGYYFAGWLGKDLHPDRNRDNPVSVIMDQPRTNITAFFATTTPQTRTWSGSGNWLTPTNWSPAGIPGSNDTVTIASGQALLTVATAIRYVQLNTGASLVFSNWNTRLEAADAVSIMSNGVVTLPAPFTETGISNRVWIVCRDFTLFAGGVINADERGFANDNGFGKGLLGTGSSGSGHGGFGGDGSGRAGGKPYGVTNAPVAPGSGGIQYGVTYGTPHGGGAVRIDARGEMVVDGTIKANAGFLTAGAVNPYNFGCGGSGGSIFLSAARFHGGTTAALEAKGGFGGNTVTGVGGGGGGRIAVWYGVPEARVAGILDGSNMQKVEITETMADYQGSLSVAGGTAVNNGQPGSIVFLTVPVGGSVFMIR